MKSGSDDESSGHSVCLFPIPDLYAGVTSDLLKRIWQHKHGVVDGFTKQYDIHDLVWYELHETMESAILREKALKNWKRQWKIRLTEGENPAWSDLYPALLQLDSGLRRNDEQRAKEPTCRRIRPPSHSPSPAPTPAAVRASRPT
jgi:putative endonuclease